MEDTQKNMEDDHTRYMQVQVRKIEIEKYCAGIGMQCDPGSEFIMEWILLYAKGFRFLWDQSQCRRCANWAQCGHQVQHSCPAFRRLADA